LDKYDHEYSLEMYLIENSTSFRDCVRRNPSIIEKIPEILEILSQEIALAEKILIMYTKSDSEFKIPKAHKYALNYLDYLITGELNELLAKNYLNITKEEDEEHFLFKAYLDKDIPKNYRDIILNHVYSEINRNVKILLILNKLHEEY